MYRWYKTQARLLSDCLAHLNNVWWLFLTGAIASYGHRTDNHGLWISDNSAAIAHLA